MIDLKAEPVAIAAAVRAILVMAGAYGLGLSAEQIAATVVAVEAVLAVIVRKQVTPA